MSRFDEFMEFQNEPSSHAPAEFWQEPQHHKVMTYFMIYAQQHAHDFPRDELWLLLHDVFVQGYEFREWLAQKEVLPL